MRWARDPNERRRRRGGGGRRRSVRWARLTRAGCWRRPLPARPRSADEAAARWEGEGAWRPRRSGRGRRSRVCSHLEALRPGRARPTLGARSPRLQRGARPFLGGPCLPRRLDGHAGARGREKPPSGASPTAVGHGGRDG